jgi:hypothetical protein
MKQRIPGEHKPGSAARRFFAGPDEKFDSAKLLELIAIARPRSAKISEKG